MCVCVCCFFFALLDEHRSVLSLSLLAGVRAQCVYVYCSVWRRAVVGWAQQERREPRQMDLSHRSWENYTGYLLVKRRRRSISLGRRVCTHLFQHQKASTLHLSILFLPFVAADINQQRIYIYIYLKVQTRPPLESRATFGQTSIIVGSVAAPETLIQLSVWFYPSFLFLYHQRMDSPRSSFSFSFPPHLDPSLLAP